MWCPLVCTWVIDNLPRPSGGRHALSVALATPCWPKGHCTNGTRSPGEGVRTGNIRKNRPHHRNNRMSTALVVGSVVISPESPAGCRTPTVIPESPQTLDLETRNPQAPPPTLRSPAPIPQAAAQPASLAGGDPDGRTPSRRSG